MQRAFQLKLLVLPLVFLPLFPVLAQDQSAATDAAQQTKPAPPDEPKKSPELVTNDTPSERESCKSLLQTAGAADKQDPAVRAFLRTIEGRWNFAYVRRGNQGWWPNHDSARPKNEIHFLFGPQALFFELRPEFALPSITGCFVYGSGHKVSAELFDLELRKPSDSAATQTVRFKLSPDHKKLEIALDAETDPEPTVQVLDFRDSNWSPSLIPR